MPSQVTSTPNLRKYGLPPYRVAVVHGGPGAPGQMAPVARELSVDCGVLEPLQTADSLEGQIQELRNVLQQNGAIPLVLIGSSWGAMLSYLLAANYPQLVSKLVMVGSGVFEEAYAEPIFRTRLARMKKVDRNVARSLMQALDDPTRRDKSAVLARLGRMFSRIDAFDPLTLEEKTLEVQYDIHQQVWNETSALRASGQLVQMGKHIQCPVVAIHGDYDPHPAQGVREPLTPILKDFRFVLLKNCGHLPWIERQAKQDFYALLRQELN